MQVPVGKMTRREDGDRHENCSLCVRELSHVSLFLCHVQPTFPSNPTRPLPSIYFVVCRSGQEVQCYKDRSLTIGTTADNDILVSHFVCDGESCVQARVFVDGAATDLIAHPSDRCKSCKDHR